MSSRYKFSEAEIAAIKAAQKENNNKHAGVRLKALKLRAEKCKAVEISKIKAAYQVKVDHPIGNTQIYLVLCRHNLQSVVLRSRKS